jgi:hypothetical protein
MVMSAPSGWRCVIVPPPNPRAAIGSALRHAFPMNGQLRSLAGFEHLLQKLRPAR